MAAVAIPGLSLAVTTNQKLTPSSPPRRSCCSPPHMALQLQGIIFHEPSQARPRLLLLPPHHHHLTQDDSPMAGGDRPPVDAAAKKAEASGQRRRPMAALYAELAALLPGVPSRASKEEVVEAATAQVKVLEDTAAVLETYRAVQQQQAGGGSGAAAVEVTSREAVCFAARLPAARPGTLRRVLEPFHRRGVEVLATTMTRRGEAAEVTVTAAATSSEVAESIKADIAGIS